MDTERSTVGLAAIFGGGNQHRLFQKINILRGGLAVIVTTIVVTHD